MMISALMMRLNSGGMPDSRITELTDWMISAPISDARIEKRPPSRDVAADHHGQNGVELKPEPGIVGVRAA
jgi:hypothetical protein